MKFHRLLITVLLLGACAVAGQVPRTYFGMSFNMAGTPWQVSPGTIRLWDTGTSWVSLNPALGSYNWAPLDNWLNLANQKHVDVLYTFGRTPQWASSKPADTYCHYGPGQCDPPSNSQYWNDFVTAIIQHVQNWNAAHNASVKVYWETWNEPNAPTWAGTTAQMVTLAENLYNIAHSIDPAAVVLTPCPQGFHAYQWMQTYLAAGGGAYADVIAFHGYMGSSNGVANPAEWIVTDVNNMRNVMASFGQGSKPLWNTEYAWDSGDNTALPNADDQAAFLAKTYILQWSLGLARVYWYMYENRSYGTLWDSTNGLHKAGVAFNTVSNWLSGATLRSPCQATADSTWTCAFTTAAGTPILIAWNSAAPRLFGVASEYTQYSTLYGGTSAVPSGGSVTLGKLPVLFAAPGSSATPPTAVLHVTPPSGAAPLQITADGSASHTATGGTVTASSINFGDGTITAGLVATHTYTTAGRYTVRLTVRDQNDLSAQATSFVNVSATTTSTLRAVLDVTPRSGAAPLTVTASTAKSHDTGGTITSSTVDFGDGMVATGTSVSHTYQNPGTYTVRATVQDDHSNTATASETVVVTTPDFNLDAAPKLLSSSNGTTAYELTVTPTHSLNTPVTFSCVHVPSGTSCTFSPAVVTPGSHPAVSILSIRRSEVPSHPQRSLALMFGFSLPMSGIALLAAGLGTSRSKLHNRRANILIIGLLFAAVLLQVSCAGTVTPDSLLALSDTVTVQASSGTHSHSIQIALPAVSAPGSTQNPGQRSSQ